MADFLIELFSEEIPARMQENALHDLERLLGAELAKSGLSMPTDTLQRFVTPRRLAIIVPNLPTELPDTLLEKKGPKTSAPQAAIEGFLRKEGLTVEQLEKQGSGKDEVYIARIPKKGERTKDVLKNAIEKILVNFPWPKSMRWGSGQTRWVRPLHSMICLLESTIIPVAFAGITAGNATQGHRFLAPDTILIHTPADYEAKLEKAFVIADRDKRRENILEQAGVMVKRYNAEFNFSNALLDEVTGLVEYPTLLVGTIDAQFMDLPPEVLMSEMRAHQKYFALKNAEGHLSPKFLITSNMTTDDDGKAIIAGNERVLRARLADGRFFYDQDRKKPLAAWAEGLKNVTFHAKIGTIADKVIRIKILASKIADYVPGADKTMAEEAASLCKADLITGMVGEFPDLQGIMGRYYALAEGISPAIADAIRDHYLPLGPDSPVPTQPVSICIALADKLDTLISMFAAGEKPTGSKDPFALRRAALGIIRIITHNHLRFPFTEIVNYNEELTHFFHERLKILLREEGISHSIIDAVITEKSDDLYRIVLIAKELKYFLSTENGGNLVAGYKRASNILAIEQRKDKRIYHLPVSPSLQVEPSERELMQALEKATPLIHAFIANEQFSEALQTLASLRPAVDSFFADVMVNHENSSIRENRLNLLALLRATFNSIGDFSKLEG